MFFCLRDPLCLLAFYNHPVTPCSPGAGHQGLADVISNIGLYLLPSSSTGHQGLADVAVLLPAWLGGLLGKSKKGIAADALPPLVNAVVLGFLQRNNLMGEMDNGAEETEETEETGETGATGAGGRKGGGGVKEGAHVMMPPLTDIPHVAYIVEV